jgi:hypothetical protein
MIFQHHLVRASTGSYTRFTLAMGRSPGFGSIPCNLRPVQTRFRYGSTSYGLTYALQRITRRSVLQKVRCQTF